MKLYRKTRLGPSDTYKESSCQKTSIHIQFFATWAIFMAQAPDRNAATISAKFGLTGCIFRLFNTIHLNQPQSLHLALISPRHCLDQFNALPSPNPSTIQIIPQSYVKLITNERPDDSLKITAFDVGQFSGSQQFAKNTIRISQSQYLSRLMQQQLIHKLPRNSLKQLNSSDSLIWRCC